MSRPIGSKTVYFSKVKEAREALAAKSLALFEMYETLIKDAIAAQEFDVAAKSLQFLLEHMPKDADGTSLLEAGVDRPRPEAEKGPKGPTIQIGIAFGAPQQKALPPAVEVIDVTTDTQDE